jgi:hypothetical protein
MPGRLALGWGDRRPRRVGALPGTRAARIAAALSRGRLTTENQVRLVKGRYEEIWDDPTRAAEAEGLAALVNEWEARQHARLAKRNGRTPGAT